MAHVYRVYREENSVTTSTVELVLKDHPNGHENMDSQDRWSLVTSSITLKWSCARNVVFLGGLSWQWSLQTGFLYCLRVTETGY